VPLRDLVLEQFCDQLVLLHDALASKLARHNLDTAAA
jgi:hypothetical protein